jgi:hypothetical protein
VTLVDHVYRNEVMFLDHLWSVGWILGVVRL